MDSAGTRPAKRQRTVLNSSDAAMAKATATKTAAAAKTAAKTTANGPLDAVDLRLFMSSLQREMGDLHRSIKASKDGRVEKAFQRLPRGMRRRTASHNAKRLPRRLRQQARRDQAADNTPSVAAGLAKRKKARPAQAWVHEKVKRRVREHQEKKLQREPQEDQEDPDDMADVEVPVEVPAGQLVPVDRLKLPTHFWMAKRAHLACPGALWHSLLVQTPADKTYRASLRSAGLRPGTCLTWDTSYMATVRLQGPAQHVHDALAAVVQPHLLDRPALRTAAGCLDAQLPRAFHYQHHDPPSPLAGPGNCGALVVFFQAVDAHTGRRAVFLRIHPVLFSHVWTSLRAAIADRHLDVALHDFRLEIGSIDLTGSGAVAALLSVLRPTDMAQNPHARAFWRLRHVDATALAPASGLLLSFDVQDSRYDVPDALEAEPAGAGAALEALLDWPGSSSDDAPPSGLFDDTRRRQATCLMAQHSLDRRRGKLPIGRKLLPTPAVDHPIPVLLTVTGAAVPASTNAAQTRLQNAACPSWTLLAPRRCIDTLWRSLHSGTPPAGAARRPLLAGLDEEHAVSLERGRPWFPADFPGTPAGWNWELESRRTAKAAWDKTPPAKKPNWDTLGELGSGYACAWEHVFGVEPVNDAVCAGTSSASEEEHQFEALRPDAQPPIVRGMCHVTWADLQAAVADSLRLHRPPQWSTPYALVTVAVEMLGRGTPLPRARVFRLPSDTEQDLRRRWRALADELTTPGYTPKKRSAPPRMPSDADMDTRIRLLGQSLQNTRLLYPRPPDESSAHHLPLPGSTDLMGFVTSGAQRFQAGKGFGIGHVSAQKLAESVVEADKEKEAGGRKEVTRLCIVRNVGETVGWLARWTVLSS